MTSHVVPHGLAQPCSTALLLSTFISCLNPRPPATREILTHTRTHSLKHTAPKHVQRHTHTDTQRSVFNKFFSSDKAKIKMPWQSVRACAFLCVQLDARGRQASGSCWSVCVVPLHGIMSAECRAWQEARGQEETRCRNPREMAARAHACTPGQLPRSHHLTFWDPYATEQPPVITY